MRLTRLGPMGVAMTLGRAAWSARRQWQMIPADRRDRLRALARRSGGRPSTLPTGERQELRQLVRDVDLGRLIRQAALDAALPRRRFRR